MTLAVERDVKQQINLNRLCMPDSLIQVHWEFWWRIVKGDIALCDSDNIPSVKVAD